jgi:DNA (cytosine-5)-methyltransferase 1
MDAGYKVLYAVDNSVDALKTFSANHPGTIVSNSDIRTVTKDSIEADLGRPIGDLDILIGGPPCQGFSWQRAGVDSDPRNDLVLEFIRIALEIKPKYFLIENVRAILSGRRGQGTLNLIAAACDSSGYSVVTKVVNSNDFGVAQNRKRVFLLAAFTSGLKFQFDFPEPYSNSLSPPMTVRDAIFDLYEPGGGQIPNNEHANLSDLNVERLKSIVAGQSRADFSKEYRLPTQDRHPNNGHKDTYGRMEWDLPSPTLTTEFHRISKGRFAHPIHPRGLTLREGARLMGFPDSFIFIGKQGQIARQIGNSVCPPVAKAIAHKILFQRTVSINPINLTVCIGTQSIKLTRTEYSLFSMLFDNLGQSVTIQRLASNLNSNLTSSKTIRVIIHRIRAKLIQGSSDPSILQTRRGGAYELDCIATV